MSLQDNLIQLRKQKGFSQEELAYQLNISRQSVSKWESGISVPELDRLVELSDLYEVSLDELVRGDKPGKQEFYISDEQLTRVVRKSRDYEYKSHIKVLGIPLVHINLGRGRKVAKGIFAIGNIAIGVVAFGGIGIGAIGMGGISIGLLLSLGGLSIGGLSFGGISIGLISFGGIALGMYANGGLAIASHIAIGGKAIGHVAIGASPSGTYEVYTSARVTSQDIYEALQKVPVDVPEWLKGLASFMK